MTKKEKKEGKNKVQKFEYLNDKFSFFLVKKKQTFFNFFSMFSFDGENKNSGHKL